MKSLSDLVRTMTLVAGLVGCTRDYSFLEQRDTDMVQRYDAGSDGTDGMKLDGKSDGPISDARTDAMPDDMRADRYIPGDVMSDVRTPDAGADVMDRDAYMADSAIVDAGPIPDMGNDSFSPCFPVPCIFPDGPSPDSLPDAYIPSDTFIPDAGMDSSVPDALTLDLGNDAPACMGLPPSQECFAGLGECRQSGLEYATCVGGSWSSTYSGCDAIAGEPTLELCDDFDRNCNGLPGREDLTEIIDNFNRADQAGLGDNALGNPWVNSGAADDWDIEGNDAVASWTGGIPTNPMASSRIGYRTTFDTLLEFELAGTTALGGGGGLRYGVNCSEGLLDGFLVKIAANNANTHVLGRGGDELGTGNYELFANVRYNLRLAYDGTNVQMKLWDVGTFEPLEWLITVAAANVPVGQEYTSLSGDLDGGEMNTVYVGHIRDGCE